MVVDCCGHSFIPYNKFLSHSASLAVADKAINSTSIVECEMHTYFFEGQTTSSSTLNRDSLCCYTCYHLRLPYFYILGKYILVSLTNIFDPFSLDVWDPFQDFPSVALSAPRSDFANETTAIANTLIDWKETPEAQVFKADCPGLKKEDVKVEIEEGRVLQISGERSKEKEDKGDTWHLYTF
nr:17.8 kDa class I heat shock protein-like [Arachis hypogaea]